MTERDKGRTWTIGEVLQWATDDFRARGLESPRLDAEVLLAFALGATRVQLVVDRERPLAEGELTRLRELVKRRRAHEPVAYLVGAREFYGRMFRVDRRVLVPRPDTETLVDVALRRTTARSMSLRALDLCTGSGCVGTTLARERPTSRVHATDASEDALAVTRENALRLGAYNLSVARSDLFFGLDPARCRFDVIVANPPYVPRHEIETLAPDVRDHEPRAALDGGETGFDLIRRIVTEAPLHLVKGGTLALEVGAGQAPETARLLASRGFEHVAATRDYGRIERVVDGLWPEGS
jgi:release factor glutamine methyltransferase